MEKYFGVKGYDGKYVSGSGQVASIEEAVAIAGKNGWEETDSDIVVVEYLPAPGGKFRETIVSVLKGSPQPFLEGIEARNSQIHLPDSENLTV